MVELFLNVGYHVILPKAMINGSLRNSKLILFLWESWQGPPLLDMYFFELILFQTIQLF